MKPSKPDFSAVQEFLQQLQDEWCAALAAADGSAQFGSDPWQREEGGGGLTRILSEGKVFERAGVGYSSVTGDTLPPSATRQRPELAGCRWQATGVSLVAHPANPHVPTVHANLRFFQARTAEGDDVWWFGGGFDLTPYYGYVEDARHWHTQAQAACAPFGAQVYPRLKRWCDEYFYLPHREEARGIGGLFFDDWTEGGFEQSYAFARSVGAHFLPAYLPIVDRRKAAPYGERERNFQLLRRGRYVEFNLVYDRGTLFGLQSGGRAESILMSMPPEVRWRYQSQPEAGSVEARLAAEFLTAREWI